MVNLSAFTRIAATAAVIGAFATGASAQIQRGETAGVGDPVYTMFVAFANQAQTADINIQVNAGQTLTESMLRAGRGEIEFYSGVPSLVPLMANNRAMYEPIADAPEAAANLRAILGFQAGVYHPIALAASGIESWEDIAGRTVFTGPPSGSAAQTSEELIRVLTGFEPGTDYEAVRLSWGEGEAALSDGRIDMMLRPAEIGSATVEQFGLSGEFRILSIPGDAMATPEMQALVGGAGRGVGNFDGSIYDGQLTEGDITALAFSQFVGTHAGVEEELVYQVTRAFWENITEVQASAFFLQAVTKDTAFTSVNIPLHPGAIRYYEEAGFTIPDALRPAN